MKTYVYLILAVLIASILIQPLFEMGMLCKDRITVNHAINNAVRVAKKESYIYTGMREGDTIIDESVFINSFARTLEAAMDLDCTNKYGTRLVFKSRTDNYNDFVVSLVFYERRDGDRVYTTVNIHSESEYKFKTKYLKEAQTVIEKSGNAYKLKYERNYTLKMVN